MTTLAKHHDRRARVAHDAVGVRVHDAQKRLIGSSTSGARFGALRYRRVPFRVMGLCKMCARRRTSRHGAAHIRGQAIASEPPLEMSHLNVVAALQLAMPEAVANATPAPRTGDA